MNGYTRAEDFAKQWNVSRGHTDGKTTHIYGHGKSRYDYLALTITAKTA